MAAVNPELIKQLREATNAGLLDCKKALSESGGDIQAAAQYLREKGLSKAAKVADRVAAEGVIALKVGQNCATIVEINCETDFVAKNDGFKAFADKVLNAVHNGDLAAVENGDLAREAIAKMGEKIDVRRHITRKIANGVINGYLHSNSRVGAIVAIETTAPLGDFARDIAMHISAMKPLYLDESEIPAEMIENERKVAIEQLKSEGKPEAMFEKIVLGKIKRFIQDNTLVGQAFVKDDKKSVNEALNAAAKAHNAAAKIVFFARFEVGEGIEKRSDNFAAEVAAQTKR